MTWRDALKKVVVPGEGSEGFRWSNASDKGVVICPAARSELGWGVVAV